MFSTFLILMSPKLAYGGDCTQPASPTLPMIKVLYEAAMKNCADCTSKVYGDHLSFCVPSSDAESVSSSLESENSFIKLAKDGFAYAISSGDSKCGQVDPFDKTEFVSTEVLQKSYEKFIRESIRVWVVGPGNRSRILNQPKTLHVSAPQSIRDCFRVGPKGFSCSPKMNRKHCCRDWLAPRQGVEAVYEHPFDSQQEIVFSTIRKNSWWGVKIRKINNPQEVTNQTCHFGRFTFR